MRAYLTNAGEPARAIQATDCERPKVAPRVSFDGAAFLIRIMFSLTTSVTISNDSNFIKNKQENPYEKDICATLNIANAIPIAIHTTIPAGNQGSISVPSLNTSISPILVGIARRARMFTIGRNANRTGQSVINRR